MDPKTKQLVERTEALLLSEDDADRPCDEFAEALCIAVREQDERARHAEEERDAFGERAKELEARLETQSRREAALHVMISNYNLPSEPKALAGAIEREREANRARISELEESLQEIVNLRDECADKRHNDLTCATGRKLDVAICLASAKLHNDPIDSTSPRQTPESR